MIESILQYLEYAGVAIMLFAVVVIVIGLALAFGRYAHQFWKLEPKQNFKRFKIELASVLTLGLEMLVLSDVIETITVNPTLKSLGFLAFLVVIRTIVSWTLTLEAKGCWPWEMPTKE